MVGNSQGYIIQVLTEWFAGKALRKKIQNKMDLSAKKVDCSFYLIMMMFMLVMSIVSPHLKSFVEEQGS